MNVSVLSPKRPDPDQRLEASLRALSELVVYGKKELSA